MLVDGDEVIHDSKRIRQYLDAEYGERRRDQPNERRPAPSYISEAMTETPEAAITLTDNAAEKIKELLAGQENAADQALRVAVRGGGCSGFQYALAFDQARTTTTSSRTDGVSVIVDKTSMQFVFGSEVDYVDGLQGAGFAVNNPNVVAACGCGSSFQVREDDAEQTANGLAPRRPGLAALERPLAGPPALDAAVGDVQRPAPSRCRIEAARPLRLPPVQIAAIGVAGQLVEPLRRARRRGCGSSRGCGRRSNSSASRTSRTGGAPRVVDPLGRARRRRSSRSARPGAPPSARRSSRRAR